MRKDLDLRRRVGFRIMKRREYMGFSALKLASLAGVHRNTISRMESGEMLSLESLWKVCQILDVTIDGMISDALRMPIPGTQLRLFVKRKKAA
jgi:transcriptional regulator with XRE-family HTH domain